MKYNQTKTHGFHKVKSVYTECGKKETIYMSLFIAYTGDLQFVFCEKPISNMPRYISCYMMQFIGCSDGEFYILTDFGVE